MAGRSCCSINLSKGRPNSVLLCTAQARTILGADRCFKLQPELQVRKLHHIRSRATDNAGSPGACAPIPSLHVFLSGATGGLPMGLGWTQADKELPYDIVSAPCNACPPLCTLLRLHHDIQMGTVSRTPCCDGPVHPE
jgi:hypothetical protein